MSEDFSGLPSWLAAALTAREFTELKPIQKAMLEPEVRGRDLRITSATGSGKTVAVAMALAEAVEKAASGPRQGGVKAAAPAVLVVAPTRELALQLAGEMRDLYAGVRALVALVTGGGNYNEELRQLRRGPTVLVATPGRLVDHLGRGTVSLEAASNVVLDEADHMLELGFRDDLETILKQCPPSRRTLLVSATFDKKVLLLANTYQRDALVVEGTSAGERNKDVEHVLYPVHGNEKGAATTNLLLTGAQGRTLIFVARRAQASELADLLASRGFSAGQLSGEMAQAERRRTLDAFREGRLQVLVATDVAARGIDVDDIRTVIHVEIPHDVEALIHRSGRTGRAGHKGRSLHLITQGQSFRLRRLLEQAGIEAAWKPVPDAAEAREALNERLIESLAGVGEGQPDPRSEALAERLLQQAKPVELVARLLERVGQEGCEPQRVTVIRPPRPSELGRTSRGAGFERRRPSGGTDFVEFDVTWGSKHGATPPRLLAMVCRRGRVDREHVGAIDVGPQRSQVQIDAEVAPRFAKLAGRPDSRDRRIVIRSLRASVATAPTEGKPPAPGPNRKRRAGRPRRPAGGPT